MMRLWCAVGAVVLSACVVRLPGLSLGGLSSTSSSEPSVERSGGAPGSAEEPSPAENSVWAKASDADFAAMLAPEYFGQLHQITAIESRPSGNVAVGTMGYSPSDVPVVERRQKSLVAKKYPGSFDLDLATCKAVFVDYEGLSETDEDVKRLCSGTGRFAGSERLTALMHNLLEFDALVDAVPDAAKAKALRTEMARRLGFKRDAFIVHGAGRWSTRLTEVPVTEWTYRTLRFAQAYVQKHQLDPALGAAFASALSTVNKTECVTRRGIFVRQYQGGSSYGEPYFEYPDYREPTPVPCPTANAIKTSKDDFATLPALRPIVGKKWVAVKPSGGWEVHRNDLGIILNQWRTADAYWERERGED